MNNLKLYILQKLLQNLQNKRMVNVHAAPHKVKTIDCFYSFPALIYTLTWKQNNEWPLRILDIHLLVA